MKRPLILVAMTLLSAALFAQPANDLCSNYVPLSVDGACLPGTTINAGTEDPSIPAINYPADVWYTFVATSNQSVIYVYPDMNLDADIIVFDNCGGAMLEFASAGLFAGETDSLNFTTTIGDTYFVSVAGYQNAPYGNFCVSVLNTTEPVIPYDPCFNFTNIAVADPCLQDNVNQDSLVKTYLFTAISPYTKISLNYEEPAYFPVVAVFETDCSGAWVVNWGEGIHVGNSFFVEFPTSLGSTYFFAVKHSDPTITYEFPLDYCVDIDVTLGTTYLENDELSLFPNPAKTDFTLTTKNATGTVELIDLTGRQVMTKQIVSQSTTLNIENLTNGIYTVRYVDGSSIVSTKLIKE